MPADADLGLRPLTARSVLLSLLLGSHPPRRPVSTLVTLGELFGVSDGTVRVALSRMAADGEVIATGGWYGLSEELLARQRRLDEGRRPRLRSWGGRWEVVVTPPGADADTRAATERALRAARLAPYRDGVWTRPANLARPRPVPGAGLDGTAPDVADPAALAAALWDLPAWGRRATLLVGALEDETDPPLRFALAAAAARHLEADPLLPATLLPGAWPGRALRTSYRRYERELAGLLAGRDARARHSAR